MKHTFPNTVVTDHKKGNKEHLLCMSDGDGEFAVTQASFENVVMSQDCKSGENQKWEWAQMFNTSERMLILTSFANHWKTSFLMQIKTIINLMVLKS